MRWKSARITLTKYKTLLTAAFIAALFLPAFHSLRLNVTDAWEVYLNGQYVGITEKTTELDRCLIEARRRIAQSADGLVYMEAELTTQGVSMPTGEVDSLASITDRMEEELRTTKQTGLTTAYSLKINQFIINMASIEEIEQLLQAAIDEYDTTGNYVASLIRDKESEINVLTANVENLSRQATDAKALETLTTDMMDLPSAGVFAAFDDIEADAEQDAINAAKDFDEFELGLMSMNFDDKVQVVETILPESEITDLATAIDLVTREQETKQTYEVVAGDTLGEIADAHNMTIEDLVAMNEILTDANSTIRVGDELLISVPEPELSVVRVEESYYEENYDAEVIYVPNDDWYTNQSVTLQQPSSGHRRVVAMVTYRNDSVEDTEIIKQEIDYEAVPKIVERGTKIPPTYIRPVSGGRISSGFGSRSAPKKGASTYHKGLDYAIPIGTAVMASSGGVVTRAGWGSGYGRVIYIQHPDGRETRYGHLSKILVSVGQNVSQGQKIALSGNTGNSTGPHLHFEIRINGTAVNPANYLN